MAEYLLHLEELLEKQVSEAVSLIDTKWHFIEALFPLFGRPLEADIVCPFVLLTQVFCGKASFLAASGPFTFLVHFHLAPQFPKQQPSLMLQSTQHYDGRGSPAKSKLLAVYSWSPRWEASKNGRADLRFRSRRMSCFQKAVQRSWPTLEYDYPLIGALAFSYAGSVVVKPFCIYRRLL